MNIVFWILAIITLGSALLMVLMKNIFNSALYMVVTFIGVAGIFIMLHADFLAAVQVLVYAGAIPILIIFAVMLTQRSDMEQTNLFSRNKVLSVVISFTLFIINSYMVIKTKWRLSIKRPPEETVTRIADILLNKYIIPFELAAILLLVALLGSIIIAKEVKEP